MNRLIFKSSMKMSVLMTIQIFVFTCTCTCRMIEYSVRGRVVENDLNEPHLRHLIQRNCSV